MVTFVGYRDVAQVGAGGLGNLYRAVRESTGGVVAIKEIRDIGAGSPMLHRARRELEALLRLKGHPYVVNVEEIIEGPQGPCLVMEFATGGSLMDRLSQGGALPAAELVLIGEHVTQALGTAHGLGIVHRDVKPHNLLIGAFGQVKVCDFGIAALTRDSTGRTQTQAMTLAYASPEELDGADVIGPPADVYSFGATFLHLATGLRPTFRERVDSGSMEVLAAAERSPTMAAVFRGVGSSLSRDPDDRPTMAELSALFDQAAFRLGGRRIQYLTVPRPIVVSTWASPADGSEDDATVVRSGPPVAIPAPAPAPAAVSAETSKPAPGWFPDPARRHQLRWWAGGEWADHVSDHGVAGVEPLNVSVAQWFPDPAGHHELRWWGGAEWTDHVSNGAALGADPLHASKPASGWFADPARRHELRWWSGMEWTDHVSDAGVSGADPLYVSTGQWFPDPAGRHELRWWTGVEWTDHVSTRGVTGIDSPPGAGPRR